MRIQKVDLQTQNQGFNNTKKTSFCQRVSMATFSITSKSDADYLKWFFEPIAEVFLSTLSKAKTCKAYKKTVRILEENGVKKQDIKRIQETFKNPDFTIGDINETPLPVKLSSHFDSDGHGYYYKPSNNYTKDRGTRWMIDFISDLNITGKQKTDFIYSSSNNKIIESSPKVAMSVDSHGPNAFVVAKSYPETGKTAVFPFDKDIHTYVHDSVTECSYPVYNDLLVNCDDFRYELYNKLVKGTFALVSRK